MNLLFLMIPLAGVAIFFDYVFEGLKKYSTFSGRANVKEWWGFHAGIFSIYLSIIAIAYVQSFNEESVANFLILYTIAMIIPSVSITFRRLQDIGLSGWLVLLSVVPILGNLFLFICTLIVGNKDENAYGKPSAFKEKETSKPSND